MRCDGRSSPRPCRRREAPRDGAGSAGAASRAGSWPGSRARRRWRGCRHRPALCGSPCRRRNRGRYWGRSVHAGWRLRPPRKWPFGCRSRQRLNVEFSEKHPLSVLGASAHLLECANPLPHQRSCRMPRRTLFVTTALPYANGPFHIGHIMEYIQADIWVRTMRMRGATVHFVGADDARRAPITLTGEKAGKTPQEFVAEIAAGRQPYFDGFHIGFDHWHSTDSPENVELSQDIYRKLKANGLIDQRTIEQFYDPVKGMFLPDRYIKGECPKCGTKEQYGDACENCGTVYAPTDLQTPYSALTGAKPVLRKSDHFFFRLSDPRCVKFLREWTQDGKLQPEVSNKVREWLDGGLNDWDITRDSPYFGIEIPGAPG